MQKTRELFDEDGAESKVVEVFVLDQINLTICR